MKEEQASAEPKRHLDLRLESLCLLYCYVGYVFHLDEMS
jgi:hypothetical protein